MRSRTGRHISDALNKAEVEHRLAREGLRAELSAIEDTIESTRVSIDAIAQAISTHWCIGCDRVVRGRWMGWRYGWWLCSACRGESACPSVDDELQDGSDWGSSVVLHG